MLNGLETCLLSISRSNLQQCLLLLMLLVKPIILECMKVTCLLTTITKSIAGCQTTMKL